MVIATALVRRQHAGPTVINPLLALMRDQVDAASRAGIRAHTINSANLQPWEQITAAVHDGAVDVLLISPERLNNPDFRDSVLPKLAGTTGLLVVDDLVDSGWTMALAARLPRRAGAPAVLPLALAITT